MSKPQYRFIGLLLAVFTLVAVLTPMGSANVRAYASDLFFSEYIEGSSFNKAIEIYNGTDSAVDLSNYSIHVFFNGSASSTQNVTLSGMLESNDVFVISRSDANATIVAQADLLNSNLINFNGDDAIALRKNGDLVDVIGQIGNDPGSEWGTGLTSTADNSITRKASICAGDPDGSNAFDPSVEWDGFATDTFTNIGTHSSDCLIVPDAPDVSVSAIVGATAIGGTETYNVDVTNIGTLDAVDVTLTIAIDGTSVVTDATFTTADGRCTGSATNSLSCDLGTMIPDATTNVSFDVVPASQTGSLVIAASATTIDETATGNNADTHTINVLAPCGTVTGTIPQYQDNGSLYAANVGVAFVTVQGVVTGDYQLNGELRGFYIQDTAGDGDDATSDGIFVYHSGTYSVEVAVGDLVQVTGKLEEPFTDEPQTQIDVTETGGGILICGTAALPTPVDITLPVPSTDYLERFEGMRVNLLGQQVVTEVYFLGRFNMVEIASEQLYNPTAVADPGAPATAVNNANDLKRIMLDDGSKFQNLDPIYPNTGLNADIPTVLRVGDSVTGVAGILGHGLSYFASANSSNVLYYRIHPDPVLAEPVFTNTNVRPTADVPANVSGDIRVASFNVLNYFNTFSSCFSGCRGASDTDEFQRQRDKTTPALVGLDADIYGLIELENDVTDGSGALEILLGDLNTATGNNYTFIDTDQIGTDAIRVGIVYDPDVVTPVGAYQTDADSIHDRPPLAQTFQSVATGDVFTVVVSHFKSKGCDDDQGLDDDQGDGQGCYNNRRKLQAERLVAWLNGNPTSSTSPENVLLLGDFNSYKYENPITTLETAGYVDTHAVFDGSGIELYTYVFSGEVGSLDYIFASGAMSEFVEDGVVWNINAYEPSVFEYLEDFKSASQQDYLYNADAYRSSDHDPVLIGLDFSPDTGDFVLSAPVDSATFYAGQLPDPFTFTWTAADNAVEYIFNLEKDGVGVIVNTTTTDTFFTLDAGQYAQISGEGQYWWSVTASNGDPVDNVMQDAGFVVELPPAPGAFTLTSPNIALYTAGMLPDPLTFSWTASNAAANYTFTVNNGTEDVIQETVTGTSINVTGSNLAELVAGSYNWDVVANNVTASTPASNNDFIFAVLPAVASYELVAPLSGTYTAPLTQFTWQNAANAVNFTLTVTRVSDAVEIINTDVNPATCGDPCVFTVVDPLLFVNGTYEWTVTATNGINEFAPTNAPITFTVDIPEPSAFMLLTPVNGLFADDAAAQLSTFTWEASQAADYTPDYNFTLFRVSNDWQRQLGIVFNYQGLTPGDSGFTCDATTCSLSVDSSALTVGQYIWFAQAVNVFEPTAFVDAANAAFSFTLDAGDIELIKNGDFELNTDGVVATPDLWKRANAVGDNVTCGLNGCVYMFRPSATENSRLIQNALLYGVDPANTLNFQAEVIGGASTRLRFIVSISYADASTPTVMRLAANGTTGGIYKLYTSSVTVGGSPVSRIKVQVNNRTLVGRVRVDNISLVKPGTAAPRAESFPELPAP